jgi:hypothetical protein
MLCIVLYRSQQSKKKCVPFSATIYFRDVMHEVSSLTQTNQGPKRSTFRICNSYIMITVKHFNEAHYKIHL